MSLIYSSLYLVSNILVPIGFMIYTEAKCFIWPNKNQEQPKKQGYQNSHTSKVQENQLKVHYGRWVTLIVSIFVFNLFSLIFSKSLVIIFLGLITKAIIIKSPESLNAKVQQAIQKLHLEVYSQMFIQKLIDFYLNFSEKLNFYIVFYRIEEKDYRIQILNRMKDSVSRIQLELQDDQQIKNKSFIVAVKKMQNTSKKIKSYENVGVNCDILKGSEIGKELLKILQEKTSVKEKANAPSISKIQQPTKDKQNGLKSVKSAVFTPRSESLQQKMKKIKQGVNIPSSQKKMFPNQQDEGQSHFTIKRSQTFDIEEFQFQESPISKKRQNNHVLYGPVRTQKNMTNQVEYSQTVTINNSQNMGKLDIQTSQKTMKNKNQINRQSSSMGQILQALDQTTQGQNQPQILPPGINISSIDQNTIHPFKVNLSSLTNPLVISGQQNQKSKILTPSLYNSQQNLLISSGKNKIGTLNNEPINKEHLANVSQVHTEIMMEKKFSEQSSIPNKLQVSIGESQYSDMFESEGQEEQAKLEIKVEAVIQNQTSSKGLKPRLDIINIELYDNKDLKFLSIYNHLIFSGKILRMYKKPDNFYELICEQSRKIVDGKQVQNNDQNVQVIKKVKFRGQAKPFMKYLTENVQ